MQNSPTFLISKMEDFSYLKSNDTLSLPANNVKHVLHSQATLFKQYSNNFNNYFQWYYWKFLANLVVILCLIKTKQTTNPPCKMIFQLNLSDMLAAVTAQLLFLVDLTDSKGSCAVKTLSQCNTFFVLVSVCTKDLIGYDRYLRVQYPVIYQERMPPFRIYVMSFLIWVFAWLNTLTICIGFLMKLEVVRGLSGFIDFSVFLVVIFFQIKTVWATYIHRNSLVNPSILDEMQKIIVKLAARIVVMFIITLLPFLFLIC